MSLLDELNYLQLQFHLDLGIVWKLPFFIYTICTNVTLDSFWLFSFCVNLIKESRNMSVLKS